MQVAIEARRGHRMFGTAIKANLGAGPRSPAVCMAKTFFGIECSLQPLDVLVSSPNSFILCHESLKHIYLNVKWDLSKSILE